MKGSLRPLCPRRYPKAVPLNDDACENLFGTAIDRAEDVSPLVAPADPARGTATGVALVFVTF